MQQRQAAAERLVVAGGPGRLVDRGGDEEVGLDEHHVGHRWGSGRRAELAQPVGLVGGAGPDLGDEPAPTGRDEVGGAPERADRIDGPDGGGQAPA